MTLKMNIHAINAHKIEKSYNLNITFYSTLLSNNLKYLIIFFRNFVLKNVRNFHHALDTERRNTQNTL